MTEDTSKEDEAEEMDQEISPELEGPASGGKGGGFWVVTTVIFVVACATLAWLYTEQSAEVDALRAEASQATSQVARLRQANRRVSGELADVVGTLKEVLEVVAELEEVYPSIAPAEAEEEVSPAEAESAEAVELEPPAEGQPAAAGPPPGPPLPPAPPPP